MSEMFKVTTDPWQHSSKESACNAEDPALIPGLETSPGEGKSNPLQYSCLGNPMEPGGLQSMGSQRVRHDWATNTFTVHSLILDMFSKETNTLSYSDTSRTLLSSRHSLPEEFFFLMAKKFQC